MKSQYLGIALGTAAAIVFTLLVTSPFGSAQSNPTRSSLALPSPNDAATAPSALTLAELERIALHDNPTLAQADAEIRAAAARKRQSGLYPNPTVGYQGEQIRGGEQGGGEQGFFVSQDIVLGGKLGLNRNIFEQEKRQAEAEAEEQRLRVFNRVRMLYHQVLAAQQMADLKHKLAKLAEDVVETSRQLGNIGQADQPDVLEAEIEEEQAELAVVSAEQNQMRRWRELAVTVGRPEMPLTQLAGTLDDLPENSPDHWMQAILEQSPAVKIAQLGVLKAEALLARAKREPMPDLQVRGGLEKNLELEPITNRTIGLQGFAEVGVQIPLFNRNPGGVGAAQADLERAQHEVQRVQLVLRQRAAALLENYATSRSTAERYRDRMIPRAQQAYALYAKNYRGMAASYPQVLIAQRTLFQLQSDYVTALDNVWANAIALQGFLLTDGLEAPARAGEMDRPVRELDFPSSTTGTPPR